MDKITVTVGIAFYNAEKYLAYAVNSVLNQTFTDFELILIDDGSTDNSLHIAQSFNDRRIRIISDKCNKGLAARLNQLVNEASGHYFARMDADDIMATDRLDTQVKYLRSHPDVDIVGSFAYAIDIKNNIIGLHTKHLHIDSADKILSHTSIVHPTVMAARQWFIDNPYDETAIRIEDFNLWLRTFETYNIVNIPEYLLFYREAGLPYLKKYLQSTKGERNEIRKWHAKIPHYRKALAVNYAKSLIYIVASVLGLRDFLISLRSKKIDDSSDITAAQEKLKNAITTKKQIQ